MKDRALRRDTFPHTRKNWLDRRLAEGKKGRVAVDRQVKTLYARPLSVYFLGSSWRWLGEPDEVVQGFFVDRLAKEGFFSDWAERDVPLRRWLLRAFSYYLMELCRRRRRDGPPGKSPDDLAPEQGSPEHAYECAFAESLVRRALERAGEICESQGLEAHWKVFWEHYYEGKSYEKILEDLCTSPARLATMVRTAAKRFQIALRSLLARDGLSGEKIDEEIQVLLEVVHR